MNKKFDNKNIGDNLNLFFFNDVARGQTFLLPKGVIIFENLKNFLRKFLLEYGYLEVYTPTFANSCLWKKSGHADKFSENMLKVEGNTSGCLKPMNCPFHLIIMEKMIKKHICSFPLKLFEFNECFRNEKSGSLNGLLRLNKFRQDDSHILCNSHDLISIFTNFLEMVNKIYSIFNFKNICFYLSTSKNLLYENNFLKKIAKDIFNRELIIKENEGAFYGPKIDIHLLDHLNREWQCGTFQLDFYTHKKVVNYFNKIEDLILVHHAILGTFERFLAIALEHLNEYLPFYINPNKFIVLTTEYKLEILHLKTFERIYSVLNLFCKPIELNNDYSKKNLSLKVKNAIYHRYYFIIFIGLDEINNDTVTIKKYNQECCTIEVSKLKEFINNNIN